MSGPLYVPVLPTRPHAVAAVKDLAPRVRDRTVPLWTLPVMTAEDTDELQQAVDKELRRVAAVQKYTPAWLDAPYADLDERAYADLLPSYWSHTALRPVTDPGLPAAHQAVATASARDGGNGLGIRIRLPGAWNDELAERTAALLAWTGPEVRVDLLLDLQTVLPSRPDAGKEALRALDALVPLASWRTIVALAGGFPDDVDGLLDRERGEADRADWDTWHEIRASERPYEQLVRYGDYGTLPARNLGRAADDSDRSRFGLLRYTTERAFLLARFWAENRGETGVTREASRWITEFPDFRGEGASTGDRWYRQCARTTDSKGTGNAGTWNQVGNVQHMTYVVRCLAGDAGRT
ncbi:beta family protein [Streptomyces hawaiiensis]|uniref:beta family protein n=1 Tax=Streptomyces hawaiiensis TaxID=67305 RepID=UPI0036506B92